MMSVNKTTPLFSKVLTGQIFSVLQTTLTTATTGLWIEPHMACSLSEPTLTTHPN